MEMNDFSLDRVLEEANQKMHELAPGESSPPALEQIGTNKSDQMVSIEAKHLECMYIFSALLAGIFSGQISVPMALKMAIASGYGSDEVYDAGIATFETLKKVYGK
jgi:hypothetical protein